MHTNTRIARPLSVAVVSAVAATGTLRADIAWDEIGQGDLSNLFDAPTPLPAALGDNFVYATMGEGATGIDRDFFTITVPPGHTLTNLWIDFYFGDDPIAFLGMVRGPAFTVGPDDASPSDIDGYVLFGKAGLNLPGTDVLPRMPLIHDPPRFEVPLGPGHYSFWVQQLDGLSEYGLNFVIDVPGPAGAWAFIAAGVACFARRRGQ